MTNLKKWLGYIVWVLLALPMVSLVLTSYLPALMTRLHPAVSLGTINAVARSMWFQSLYAEADF